jgi:hypothetical protein
MEGSVFLASQRLSDPSVGWTDGIRGGMCTSDGLIYLHGWKPWWMGHSESILASKDPTSITPLWVLSEKVLLPDRQWEDWCGYVKKKHYRASNCRDENPHHHVLDNDVKSGMPCCLLPCALCIFFLARFYFLLVQSPGCRVPELSFRGHLHCRQINISAA